MSKFKLKDKVFIDHNGELYPGIIVGLRLGKSFQDCCVAILKGDPEIKEFWKCRSCDFLNRQLLGNRYNSLPFLTEEEFETLGVKFGYFISCRHVFKCAPGQAFKKTDKELGIQVIKINNELNE